MEELKSEYYEITMFYLHLSYNPVLVSIECGEYSSKTEKNSYNKLFPCVKG